ncbi:unnamed protein product [Paramecium sonneborni]|uniref:Uncharacterized protein n=1 Tax=Paramecium sonneborni TaxID=65129 RepID=A0A8S1L6M2_9CILI|nr:unnamed protein product [Paramecium sonneborni]
MSLGINLERYQFDRRLKDLQDKILSLNYRAPKEQVPQIQPVSEPQYLNNQYYPQPIYYSPQLLYGFSNNLNTYTPYLQYSIDNKFLKKENEEKKRVKELERKYEIQKVEEKLAQKQELMIANLKKDILDYIDPYIYGNSRIQQNFVPQQQFQQSNQTLTHQTQNQVPLYLQYHNNPSQIFQDDNLSNPQSYRTSFLQAGQNSLNQFDHKSTIF